jgi:carboxyl-terminal processing protease
VPKGKHGESPDPLLDSESGDSDEELYDQLDAESQDEVKEDFEVLFARDVLLKAPYLQRQRMLEAAKPFVEEKRKEEQQRINSAIAALGVDWSAGPRPHAIQLATSLKPGPETRIQAGQVLQMELTVENRGSEPLYRLRAYTESDNLFLDRREFVFGEVKPGEKKTWSVPVKLPKDLTSRRDDVTVKFFDDAGALPDTLVSELNFGELPRPAFAFNWQVLDTCPACNGDGLIQRGEEVELLVDVTNRGDGKALSSFAQIKNASDSNIFIDKGRFKLGELAPGQTQTARFSLEVKKGYTQDNFALKFAVVDEPLEEFATEKIVLKVADRNGVVEPRHGVVRLAPGTALLSSPSPEARTLFKLTKEAVLAQTAAIGEWAKVELEPNRFVFVRSQDAHPTRGKPLVALKDLEAVPARVPPQISLSVDTSQGAIVATGDRFTLSGKASEPLGLLDLYILVNDQKVFFKTADPRQNEPTHMTFSTDFPLKEGNNYVVVVARESQDYAARKTIVIRRRPAAVAQAMANSAHHEVAH